VWYCSLYFKFLIGELCSGTTNIRGRLSNVDFLIKTACFVKNEIMFAASKTANLN
jgi:hypothetical protein